MLKPTWETLMCSGGQNFFMPSVPNTFFIRHFSQEIFLILIFFYDFQNAVGPQKSFRSSPCPAPLLTIIANQGTTFVLLHRYCPCVYLKRDDSLQSVMGTYNTNLKYHKIHWTLIKTLLFSHIGKEKEGQKRIHPLFMCQCVTLVFYPTLFQGENSLHSD